MTCNGNYIKVIFNHRFCFPFILQQIVSDLNSGYTCILNILLSISELQITFFLGVVKLREDFLFVSRGQFSGVDVFDFSSNCPRVNFVCYFKSVFLAKLSEFFGPVWQFASSSKSIWLSISPVDGWSLVEWFGASSQSVAFEGLFCFVGCKACCCCRDNWASASEWCIRICGNSFLFVRSSFSGDKLAESLLLLLELFGIQIKGRFYSNKLKSLHKILKQKLIMSLR